MGRGQPVPQSLAGCAGDKLSPPRLAELDAAVVSAERRHSSPRRPAALCRDAEEADALGVPASSLPEAFEGQLVALFDLKQTVAYS